MEAKVNYVLVGLFVLVLGAALIGVVLWLTVGTQAKIYQPYKVYVRESVSGLNPQASVKYRGVDVGRVEAITLDPENPERVELRLGIEPQTPVRENTRAVLKTQGLTGLAYVELTGSSRNAPPLNPTADNPVPVIPSGPSLVSRLEDAFTQLSQALDTLLSPENQQLLTATLGNVEQLTRRSAELLDENNQRSIAGLLDNLETISGTLAQRSERLGEAIDSAARTLTQAATISNELPKVLARVNNAVLAVEEMSQAIQGTTGTLEQAVQASQRDLQRLTRNTAPEVGALIGELRQLTDIVQRFGRELERNPRMLLFGRQPGQPGPGE